MQFRAPQAGRQPPEHTETQQESYRSACKWKSERRQPVSARPMEHNSPPVVRPSISGGLPGSLFGNFDWQAGHLCAEDQWRGMAPASVAGSESQ